MGFQPKKEKDTQDFGVILRDREKALEISPHVYILLLRKSASKLKEYVDCYVTTKTATSRMIDIKYKFSKCRPEVLAMMEAMAKEPDRFEFSSFDNQRKVFTDKVHGTYFQYYHFGSGRRKLYINSEEFLTETELEIMSYIIESLDVMRLNQYKLQSELRTLEAQKNVFETYKNEKLSS